MKNLELPITFLVVSMLYAGAGFVGQNQKIQQAGFVPLPQIQEYVSAGFRAPGGCVASQPCTALNFSTSGAVAGGAFTGTSFTASAGSGSNGLALSTNGARIDYGAGASDYASSDGTTVAFAGPISSTASSSGTFTGTAGSGSNAFAVSTNGARTDFGAGASDYASSDGTTVTFAGPLSSSSSASASYTASAGSGSNAFAASTNGARFDIGAGSNDYFSSNGTTVTTPGNLTTSLTFNANLIISNRGTGANAYEVVANGARYDIGIGTNDYLESDGTAVKAAGYGVGPGTAGQFAGAPTAGDCDADAERGRLALDTTNNRLYVCNGASRGWDYAALTD